MTTTPFALARVSLDGGAWQTGAVTLAPGQVVQLSAQDKSLWTKSDWTVFGPPGWPIPAGWTNAGDGKATFVGTTNDPPSFTAPAITGWGKWMVTLVVNDGIKEGNAFHPDVRDSSLVLRMDSENGFEDVGTFEEGQVSPLRKWAGAVQNALRRMNNLYTQIPGQTIWMPGNYETKSSLVEITTSNATPTTVTAVTVPFAANEMRDISATVRAYKPGAGADSMRINVSGAYLRDTTGGVVAVGVVNKKNGKENTAGASAWTADLVISTNDVLLQVTGQAATTIKWAIEHISGRRN